MGNIASKFNLLPVVLVLICLAAFVGCELSEPQVPVESNKGLGLSLIYPPEMDPEPSKALDHDGLVRVWLFQLGADEEAAFTQRPVVEDPSWIPAAYGEGPENRPLVLSLASPIEGNWWRLFIDSDVLGGKTSFRLHPNELERVVNVVLAPKTVLEDRFSIYNGFVSPELSEPTGSEPGPPTITYPVALENTQPLDGLYLRFVVEADSATILNDFGSRINDGGGPEFIQPNLQRLVVADPNVVAYQLRIVAEETLGHGALLLPGNDVLLYVVAHGDTSRSDICFDQERALVFTAGDMTPVPVGILNPGDCDFPQVVDLTVASPSDGQQFDEGEIIPIRWTMAGTPGTDARIDLIHQGVMCGTIVESTPNDGEFDWPAVCCSESPGPYTIRITDLASGESSDSDGTFLIGSQCQLVLTSPNGGERIPENRMIQITWESEGLCGEFLDLDIVGDGSSCPLVIAEGIPNTGSFGWVANRCGDSYGGYKVRILDHDSGAADESDEAFSFQSPVDDFLLISAGTFTMGSPGTELGHAENGSEEQHTVTLNGDFWLSSYEVSDELWQLVMGGFSPSVSFRPKVNTSWDQAILFCNKLSQKQGLTPVYEIYGSGHVTWNPEANGYRLPTEAEWEYACRAGSNTAYANGEITNGNCSDPVLDQIGRYCGNGENQSSDVGSLIPNSWGLYDMHGNAAEWCWDVYSSTLGTNPATDPVTGGYDQNSDAPRVVRGGGWQATAVECRSAVRLSAFPNNSNISLGFRLARSAP